ncbi:polysaccharide pyruvyl transferase family protein [Sedimentimonas flavescens]|uniref:polysaccharide pyruvyl transferase family protein n=1 Tax=Sedimentimonas flavescens TaxID=2851012 RepID=UPI0021A2B872|nr:polysaccharide pyruvyl transferase family protein [Sedimentimonas flavescens]MCT2538823.1 polysaccharide pyruvyl transferase family protein [Sedimentimonas flavescens]
MAIPAKRRQRAAIRLFWWKPEVGINLGDEVNEKIVEYASGRAVIRKGLWRSDLFAIGSILDQGRLSNVFESRTAPLHVWGSGTMARSTIGWSEHLRLSAVRGPLTRGLVAGPSSELTLGDPGLLAPRVWSTKPDRKRFSWGLVPHWSQIEQPWVKRLLAETPEAVLIDVRDPDIATTFATLASCEAIASSSLHGLIFADAWRIPNIWIDAGRLHRGGAWKFRDYFDGVGRPWSGPIAVDQVASLATIDIAALETAYFATLDSLADALEAAFPTELKAA